MNVESGSWREALVERLAVTPRTPLYLRLQHAVALDVVACTQKLLQGECQGSEETGSLWAKEEKDKSRIKSAKLQ